MQSKILYENGNSKWVMLGRDPQKKIECYRYK